MRISSCRNSVALKLISHLRLRDANSKPWYPVESRKRKKLSCLLKLEYWSGDDMSLVLQLPGGSDWTGADLHRLASRMGCDGRGLLLGRIA